MYDSTMRVGRRVLRVGDFDAVAVGVAARADDRMQQEVDLALAALDLRADGVDEERHVVVDDLDDGVLETPAVLRRRVGLKRRTFGVPGVRCAPNSHSDSAPPRSVSKEV